MKKTALPDKLKKLLTTTTYGGAFAAPALYVGNEALDALERGQQEKISPKKSIFNDPGIAKILQSLSLKDKPPKELTQHYFKQLQTAPQQAPGDIVTGPAFDFVEKRAALQEGQNKEAFFGAIKRLFSGKARDAHKILKVQRAAEQAAARIKAIEEVGAQARLDTKALQSMMPAPAAPTEKGLLGHMLGPKGLLIGGSLVGIGALGEPALQRFGFKGREIAYPGISGLPERVRMDELAAESFATSIGKELGKSTVGLVGDVLSKGVSLPGDALRGHQRQSIFEALKQEDDVIARSDPKQLNEAYHTMVRFAPTLATDKNAVKTFLRESILYGTGPNFMAIKQLADAEKAVNPTALVKVSR